MHKDKITDYFHPNCHGNTFPGKKYLFYREEACSMGWSDDIYIYIYIYIKGKAVPLQACSGPEGSRKLRFPDFMTMAQDGGKIVSLTHRPLLPPGNAPGTHFC